MPKTAASFRGMTPILEDYYDRNYITDKYFGEIISSKHLENAKMCRPYGDMMSEYQSNKGTSRFTRNAISQSIFGAHFMSEEDFREYLEAKDKKGNFAFNGDDIRVITKEINKENGQHAADILKLAYDNTGIALSARQIALIFKYLNKENEDCLPIVLKHHQQQLSDVKSASSYSPKFVSAIFEGANQENSACLPMLLEAKKDGKSRFDYSQIGSLLENINSSNKKYLPMLLEAKDGEDYRFDCWSIRQILEKLNDDNGIYLSQLLSAKHDGEYRFQSNDIYIILSALNRKNGDCLYGLINWKTPEGEPRFEEDQIAGMLRAIARIMQQPGYMLKS